MVKKKKGKCLSQLETLPKAQGSKDRPVLLLRRWGGKAAVAPGEELACLWQLKLQLAVNVI